MADPEIDVVRQVLASHPRPTNLAERRKRLDALGAQYSLPEDVRVEGVDANAVAAEWTTTPVADPSRVILFLHGGGYISGSLDSHRHMIAQAGREAQARTLSLGYRLAPEHPFPAALDDALAGYRFLLSTGFRAKRIVVAGESAGGGLAIAMLVSARDAGLELSACTWCSSPLDAMTIENGPTLLIRGSHQVSDQEAQEPRWADVSLDRLKLEDKVAACCPAGSGLFFTSKVIHAAGHNRSEYS